jgi:predicted Ser/Thr protein kinase
LFLGLLEDRVKKHIRVPFSEISLLKELNEGAYGQVCLAKWKGSLVALKFCKNESDTEAFYKEAKIMLYDFSFLIE